MNQLEAIGGIVPREPIAREIDFEGKKATFFFVQHGYADMLAKMGPDATAPEGKRKDLVILASTLRLGETGDVVPTYEQLVPIKPGLIKKLIETAYEINSPDSEDDAKN